MTLGDQVSALEIGSGQPGVRRRPRPGTARRAASLREASYPSQRPFAGCAAVVDSACSGIGEMSWPM